MDAVHGQTENFPTLVGFDITRSTQMLTALGRETFEANYRASLFRRAQTLCGQFDGRQYQDHQGDALLFHFKTGAGATQFASVLMHETAEENSRRAQGDEPLVIRIAVHTAIEPMIADERGDYGFHPDMACLARILSDARPSQIIVSETTERTAFPDPQWQCWQSRNVLEFGEMNYFELLWNGASTQEPGIPLNVGAKPVGWEEYNYRAKLVDPLISGKSRQDKNWRLIVLHGTFGTGKTVLADYATRLIRCGKARFHKDGVFLINLIEARDPDQIWSSIATQLNISDFQEDSVVHYLRQQRIHLTLDNFEQFLTPERREKALSIIKKLLATEYVTVLVTSRELLDIGETVVSVERFHTDNAVELFHQCGNPAAVKRAGIAAICDLLECHPLAVKLTAKRTTMCSLDEILRGVKKCLDEGDFSLLDQAGKNSYSDDYRKTYAAIQWSFDLLSEAERILLRRLAVFRTWHNLAATTVCADATLNEEQIGEEFYHLLDHFLIEPVENPHSEQMRFRQHELVRSFCKKQLEQNPEENQQTRQKCFHFFLDYINEVQQQIHSDRQIPLLAEVDDDYNNLQSAVEWGKRHHDYLAVAKVHVALSWYWYKRGLLRDGNQRMTAVRQWYEEFYLPRRTELSEEYELAYADLLQAWCLTVYRVSGNAQSFHEALTQCIEILRNLHQQERLVDSLSDMALAHFESGVPDAIRMGQAISTECLQICHEIGYQYGEMRTYGNLVRAALYRRDFSEAEQLGKQMMEVAEQQSDLWNRGVALYHLVIASIFQGKFEESRRYLTAGITIYEELRTEWVAPLLLIGFAQLAAAQQQWYTAYALSALAQSCAAMISLPLLPVEQGLLQQIQSVYSSSARTETANEDIPAVLDSITVAQTPPFAQFWIMNDWQPPTLTEAVTVYLSREAKWDI